jgi:hypothetical protein
MTKATDNGNDKKNFTEFFPEKQDIPSVLPVNFMGCPGPNNNLPSLNADPVSYYLKFLYQPFIQGTDFTHF